MAADVGDSGAPVYKASNMYGILNGDDSTGDMWYSKLNNVEWETSSRACIDSTCK